MIVASNFDFLKEIDKNLFDIIEDSQKLFRDGYFNQSIINTRIFAETLAKKMYGKKSLQNGIQMTFDDILNCLKDNINDARQKEIIDDMFFIKQEGNKCAHGETLTGDIALEIIKRAFEISINYCYKINPKVDNLLFDDELLVTQKHSKNSIVEKYVELSDAAKKKEDLLKNKQQEFSSKAKEDYVELNEEGLKEERIFKDKNKIKNSKKYSKKEPTPAQKRVKERVKQAKKELKNTINKTQKKKNSSAKISKKHIKRNDNKIIKVILFYIFVIISILLLSKMIFFI